MSHLKRAPHLRLGVVEGAVALVVRAGFAVVSAFRASVGRRRFSRLMDVMICSRDSPGRQRRFV